ncbi:uncharacterized protein LOC129763282 [Toxorhynchites rutilus septentrionalis]|uniref:uncharacterized protein LOC129763282 n=1 Tax=Toxorhynchites rutilus septentrionalis TaxID=329112 RepID=UPI00247AD9CB|nr:uncharacterized protein LOC129763282 [Toxorhynchites rutilus septentrionalis]
MDPSGRFVLLAISAILLLTTCFTSGSDIFAYKEDVEDNPDRHNANNRTPIYIPGRCGNNEILYPGDQSSDWVCDCRPGHVYHPTSLGCHPLYTQGYCPMGEYVEILPGALIPRCTKNICTEKEVPFKGKCVILNRNNEGICPTILRIRHVVGVNEMSMQLDCIASAPIDLTRITTKRGDHPTASEQIVITKDGNVLFLTASKCAPGSAAQVNGTCPT